jgi:acyl carrier protein
MAELWGTLLDVPDVGPGDNFFDLGGHSLLAAHAVSRIERTFGVRVPIKTLLVSSLSQVAAEIDRVAAGHSIADRCDEAPRDVSPRGENSNVGRLSSWFKNARNGDRFQDGSQPC